MTAIRLARKNDSVGIARLMKESYDPSVLAVTIYGCDGIKHYLDAQLSLPDGLADARYVVAIDGDDIVGFAECKYVRSALFLNYICTSRESRGSGLAPQMLREATRLVREEGQSTMYLDVFRDNTNAWEWYRKMGFSPTSQTAWWRIPLRSAPGKKPGRISGHAQADACQRAFGFSNLTVTTSQRSYLIGKLGSSWFKTNQPCLLNDDEAMASLALLDSKRVLLGLLPSDYPCERIDKAERLHVADRMSIDIDVLLHTLADRRPPQ